MILKVFISQVQPIRFLLNQFLAFILLVILVKYCFKNVGYEIEDTRFHYFSQQLIFNLLPMAI